MTTHEQRISALETHMEQVATKSDLEELRAATKSDLGTAITALQNNLEGHVATNGRVEDLEEEMKERFRTMKEDTDEQFNSINNRLTDIESGIQEILRKLENP